MLAASRENPRGGGFLGNNTSQPCPYNLSCVIYSFTASLLAWGLGWNRNVEGAWSTQAQGLDQVRVWSLRATEKEGFGVSLKVGGATVKDLSCLRQTGRE